MDFLTTLSMLLNAISTFIAIWLALFGIDAWRREHAGKRRIELAEDTLALFYEAKDVIREARHPASLGGELQDIKQGDDESDKRFDARKNASIVYVRFQRHHENLNKLHAMRYRFMAQIGKDKAKPIDDIWAIIGEIKTAAFMLSRLWPRDVFQTDAQYQAHRVSLDKYEAVFWDGFSEDDPINPRVDAAIMEMEAICDGVITGEGSLYYTLNHPFGWSWVKSLFRKK